MNIITSQFAAVKRSPLARSLKQSLPLWVGGSVLLATLGLWQAANVQERTQIESKVSLAAEAIKYEVQGRLNARIVGLKQIAQRWAHQQQPTETEGKNTAQAYIDFYPNCQTIQWLDDSFQPIWTVAQPGMNAPTEESHRKALLAKQGKWPDTIVIPSLSERGSQELWAYIPTFDNGNFQGFLFASFRTDGLFKTILKQEILPDYGLGVFEGTTQIFSRYRDSQKNAEIWGKEISFPLDGIVLQVQVWPTSKVLAEAQSPLPKFLLLSGLLVSMSLGFAVHSAENAREKAKQIEEINRALNHEISDRRAAEIALRQHIQTIDLANDAIVIRTLDDTIAYWNQGAERLYGWKKEETAGNYIHTFLQTIFPQPIEEVLAFCKCQGYWQGELIHTKRDGMQIVVASRWTLQRDENSQPIAILEIDSDITEQKQAQEALQQSEARFRELAEQQELLNRLASQIRNSLELNSILETAVQEIRHLLHVEACTFAWYRYEGDRPQWEVVQEAKVDNLPSLLGYYPLDRQEPIAQQLLKLEIVRIDDVENIPDPDVRQSYRQINCHSIVMLPIQTGAGEIGIFSCSQYTGVRHWSDWEVEVLNAVALQLAIAISQSELYSQSRESARLSQEQAVQLKQALLELKLSQSQLIQSEKMSSLGQLVAGVAHEINNPVNFIYGNLTHAKDYTSNILGLLQLYQETYPNPTPAIQEEIEAIELDFLIEDLPKLLSSMKIGADRIREIVLSLRNFSRLDEADMKEVDIHEGIKSTLMILQNRLKAKPEQPAIQVIEEFGNVPLVECYPGQLNQVFMNIITNAIDAIEESNKNLSFSEIESNPSTITICTKIIDNRVESSQLPLTHSPNVAISITDNGPGMSEDVRQNLFNPFFTTKPIGKGTGLGLAISYDIIVEKHGGSMRCISSPGQGSQFEIVIPLRQNHPSGTPTGKQTIQGSEEGA